MAVWSRAVVRYQYRAITHSIRGFCYKPPQTDLKVSPPANFPANSPAKSHLVRSEEAKGKNVQWVFLGCPGVGKGTYAARLSKLLGVPHIATGDLVRQELSTHSPLASQLVNIVNEGKLISDEIIIDLLSTRLEAGEAKGETGFILDGFPRTLRQALPAALGSYIWRFVHSIVGSKDETDQIYSVYRSKPRIINNEILEGVMDIDLVINLKLQVDALIAKCLGRRTCSECGGNYNVACIDIKSEDGNSMYMPPLLPPSHCETKLIMRSDDTEDIVKERLRIYNEMSRPVEDFYRRCGKLLEFHLPGGIPESWPKLLEALNIYDDNGKKSAAA